MKKFIVFSLLFIAISCKLPAEEQVKHLNGYWEIEKVEFPTGETKEFSINQTIDYIELKTDSTGFRKKLQPQFDGTFLTTNDTDNFTVNIENNKIILVYKTPLSIWKENILKVNKDQLITINEEDLKYFYKRFEKLEIK